MALRCMALSIFTTLVQHGERERERQRGMVKEVSVCVCACVCVCICLREHKRYTVDQMLELQPELTYRSQGIATSSKSPAPSVTHELHLNINN